MTSLRVSFLIVFAALAIVAPRPSDASSIVTIDFEAQANGEVLSNQFFADHILFANFVVLEAFDTLNEIDFPPSSGVHAISALIPAPAVIEFTQPARLFSAHLTTFTAAEVVAFLSDGTSVSTLIAPNLGVGTTVSFSGEIDRIVFGQDIGGALPGVATSLTLDDVVFAIPEPSAFLIMVAGLIPVSAAIRRRARARA